MPPALNHVSTRKVACKNPGAFPDGTHEPEWRIVRRRGIALGHLRRRRPGIVDWLTPTEHRNLWHAWHAVTIDLEPITNGDWDTAFNAVVAANPTRPPSKERTPT